MVAVALALPLMVADAHAVGIIKAETAASAATFVPLAGLSVQPPEIACNTNGCLVVWVDSRLADYRLWARRIGPDGVALDRASFLISADASTSREPAVATDGSRFMVAWSDAAGHLFATRVDPDGTRRTSSANGFTASSDGPREIALAFGGGGYLAVYSLGLSVSGGAVYARRISAEGQFLDAQPISIATDPSARGTPDVIWTGAQFVVVWNAQQSTTANVALGMRVLGDGTMLDATGFFVASLGGFSNRPRLAFGGNVLLLIAGGVPGYQVGQPDAVLLDANGKNGVRVPLPFWTTTQAGPGQGGSAAWNGANFVVTWTSGPTNDQTVAARVSTSGTVLDPAGVVLTQPSILTPTEGPSVAGSAGGTSFIAYADHTYPNDTIRLVSFSDTGSEGHQSDPPLTTAAPAQRLLASARGVGQSLIVWSDEAQGSKMAALEAVRVSDDGTVLDAQPIVLSPAAANKAHASASVAWGSGVYLAAWWEQTSLTSGAIQVARISADGQMLDVTPAVLATGLFADRPTQVAASGSGFLVSWSRAAIIVPAVPPTAQLVGGDGKPVGNSFQIGPASSSWPYATLGLDGYDLAAWTQFTSPTTGLQMETIAFTGEQSAPQSVTTSRQASQSLTFVRGPGQVLLWVDGHAGILMSADSPFTTIAAPIDIGRAIGTPSWNGSLFASAAPTALGFETADTGVDVSLLAPNLTLVGGPTTIVDRRLPTSGATATGLGSGKSLIAYSRLMPDADFGNVRVRFQIVDSQPAPEADGGATGGDASAPDGRTADAAVATDTAAGDARAPSDATSADAAREAGVPDAGASDGSPDGGANDASRETAASSDAVADTRSERSAGTSGAGCSCASAGRDTLASGDAWILGALFLGLATALQRRRRNTWSRGSAR